MTWLNLRRMTIRQEQKFNLVLSLRMPDNLFKSKVQPLMMAKRVGHIAIVCDHPARMRDHFTFPVLDGVVYQYPPLLLQNLLGRMLSRFIWLFWITIQSRAKVLMSYGLVCHGVSVKLVGLVLRRLTIHQLIGGMTELEPGQLRDHWLLQSLANSPEWFKHLVRATLMTVLRRFDVIIVKGRHSLQELTVRHVNTWIRISPGGVDVKRFNYIVRSPETKVYDLLTVARLSYRKNIPALIDTVELVKKKHPGVRSLVIGSGPEEKKLTQIIADRGLQQHIELIGHHDAVEFYAGRARIFVLPSYSEGLSTAMTEAMAMGLPAVVSDVGDMSDLVIDGVTGYLVPQPFRPADFARAVIKLMDDEDLCQKLARNARELVVAEYSLAAETTRWDKFFDELILTDTAGTVTNKKQRCHSDNCNFITHKGNK